MITDRPRAPDWPQTLGARSRRFKAFGAMLALLAATSCAAAAGIHLGVATCAGSNCHGSTKALDASNVLQNEFVTWHREDKHAAAYRVLHEAPARRIAANLGLANAHEAPACLVCHSDFVPPAERGRRFQLADGVGCEACHGGAENWLGPHVSGKRSHADNIALGLYPTSDPARRAALCMGCHVGDAEHEITHRIMGAGHPRLAFELDTFSEIQPAHFRVDEDYRARKPVAAHIDLWAIGQLHAARRLLANLRERRYDAGGLFPELIDFNCHSCHRGMSPPHYSGDPAYPPGEVRVADANLVMAEALMSVFEPDDAVAYRENLAQLHRAVHADSDTVAATTSAMERQLDGLARSVRATGVSETRAAALYARIAALGSAGQLSDYARAEQAVMALDALRESSLPAALAARLPPLVEDLFAALRDENSYDGNRVAEIFNANAAGDE